MYVAGIQYILINLTMSVRARMLDN